MSKRSAATPVQDETLPVAVNLVNNCPGVPDVVSEDRFTDQNDKLTFGSEVRKADRARNIVKKVSQAKHFCSDKRLG